MRERRLQAWLRRQVWDASAWRVFAIALALAPVCFVVENLCERLADTSMSAMGWASRLEAIKDEGVASAGHWWGLISPLLLAPVQENGLCLF